MPFIYSIGTRIEYANENPRIGLMRCKYLACLFVKETFVKLLSLFSETFYDFLANRVKFYPKSIFLGIYSCILVSVIRVEEFFEFFNLGEKIYLYNFQPARR